MPASNFAPEKFPDLAQTPPIGWNRWNKFQGNVDETIVRAMAVAMATNSMKDAGYQYINIDDCWQGERDAQGFIQADAKNFLPASMRSPIMFTRKH